MKNTIILHHTPRSPFSEKVRLMLDLSNKEWMHVQAPVHSNKRTIQKIFVEGYSRRIPLLQIGADIYCDSSAISDQLAVSTGIPEYSKENLSDYRDFTIELEEKGFTAFFVSIPQKQLLSAYFKDYSLKDFYGFVAGRVGSFKGVDMPKPNTEAEMQKKEKYLNTCEEMLNTSKYLISNKKPTQTDFVLYHLVWYSLKANVTDLFDGRPNIKKWYLGMKAGRKPLPKEISGKESLMIAKDSKPQAIPKEMQVGPMIGREVSLIPDDVSGPGTLAVTGIVVGEDDQKVILKRETKETGIIHIHFPKHALGACF